MGERLGWWAARERRGQRRGAGDPGVPRPPSERAGSRGPRGAEAPAGLGARGRRRRSGEQRPVSEARATGPAQSRLPPAGLGREPRAEPP